MDEYLYLVTRIGDEIENKNKQKEFDKNIFSFILGNPLRNSDATPS